jgi:hypothetical protein
MAGDASLTRPTALPQSGLRLLVSTGGRVLTVCGRGPDVRAARDVAYAAVDAIDWPDGFCRRDIGWRAGWQGRSELLPHRKDYMRSFSSASAFSGVTTVHGTS